MSPSLDPIIPESMPCPLCSSFIHSNLQFGESFITGLRSPTWFWDVGLAKVEYDLGLCPGELMVHRVYVFWGAEEMAIMLHFEPEELHWVAFLTEETM